MGLMNPIPFLGIVFALIFLHILFPIPGYMSLGISRPRTITKPISSSKLVPFSIVIMLGFRTGFITFPVVCQLECFRELDFMCNKVLEVSPNLVLLKLQIMTL